MSKRKCARIVEKTMLRKKILIGVAVRIEVRLVVRYGGAVEKQMPMHWGASFINMSQRRMKMTNMRMLWIKITMQRFVVTAAKRLGTLLMSVHVIPIFAPKLTHRRTMSASRRSKVIGNYMLTQL